MPRADARFHGSDQFWIHEPELLPDAETWDQSNGLVVTAEYGTVVLTSEWMGQVQVELDARAESPVDPYERDGLTDEQAWDDIVEISITCYRGPLLVLPLDDDANLPRIDTQGPGHYRLRVHARNRDIPAYNADGFRRSTDEYLLVSWPEPSHRPPLSIRLTDRRGLATRLSLNRHPMRSHTPTRPQKPRNQDHRTATSPPVIRKPTEHR